MGEYTTEIIVLLISIAISFFVGWILSTRIASNRLQNSKEKANEIIENAEKEAKNIKREKELEIKDEWYKLKQQFERETKLKRQEIERLEKSIANKESSMDRKADLLNKKESEIYAYENDLKKRDKYLTDQKNRLDSLIEEQNKQLEKIAQLTADEAKKILMNNLLDKAKLDAAKMIKDLKEEALLDAKREAQKLIISAIQRSAADHSAETTVSVVNLPNEEMKGRIIGREGRNIRSFEIATGIQVVIDDTPEAVVLSGFDPLRREIAKMALEKLITDGRIHPGRIEETVDKAKAEMDENIIEAGEQALVEVGVNKMHPQMIKLLGKLKYRTSYGQNVLKHSIEVANLTGLMAAELGLDANIAKRAGLLHDIGKSVDKYTIGTHVQIGFDLAKKYNENQIVLNAISSHHEDEPPTSPISILVQAADAISGSRPGARRETLENYVKRLVKLEELATSFEGVNNSFAIQAGREIRVIVEPSEITDVHAFKLAEDISEKIENEMEYPGQIKVTVIRELRAVEYAK
ncbi:ribonuclease Y [candidate division KSB1 bacterium]